MCKLTCTNTLRCNVKNLWMKSRPVCVNKYQVFMSWELATSIPAEQNGNIKENGQYHRCCDLWSILFSLPRLEGRTNNKWRWQYKGKFLNYLRDCEQKCAGCPSIRNKSCLFQDQWEFFWYIHGYPLETSQIRKHVKCGQPAGCHNSYHFQFRLAYSSFVII